MSEQKIPKKIHYCWIGGKPIPEHNKKIMESWKKFCPDYEIIEWNESNYDFTKNRYMREAFENKQWAFAPDYARLDIIYEYGGIYLDVDVELVKPLDDLLNLKGFAGFQSEKFCAFGLGFGAVPKLPIIKELRDCYENLRFVNEDGTLNKEASPKYQTECLVKKGLILNNINQKINDLTIYSTEYFCPKDLVSGEINLTENTYSIHHFDASWVDSGAALIRKDVLNSWGVTLSTEEEAIYYNILRDKNTVKSMHELYVAINMAEKIFAIGKNYYETENFYKAIQDIIFSISELGIRNKITSLRLYFTIFRKWKIFKTPRAKLRYVYHSLRNLLHV